MLLYVYLWKAYTLTHSEQIVPLACIAYLRRQHKTIPRQSNNAQYTLANHRIRGTHTISGVFTQKSKKTNNTKNTAKLRTKTNIVTKQQRIIFDRTSKESCVSTRPTRFFSGDRQVQSTHTRTHYTANCKLAVQRFRQLPKTIQLMIGRHMQVTRTCDRDRLWRVLEINHGPFFSLCREWKLKKKIETTKKKRY